MSSQEDLYLYSIEELIAQYEDFNELLDMLIESLSDINIPSASSDKISNQTFLQMMSFITSNYHENISLSDIADDLYLNSNYLSQIFKKETGITFSRYLTDLRIGKAKKLLEQSNFSINEIAMKVGFNDYFYFLKIFKKVVGVTPSQYRSG